MTLSDKIQFVVDHCMLDGWRENMFAGNRNDKLKFVGH